MFKPFLAAAALSLAAAPALAQPAQPASAPAEKAAQPLTVDSSLHDLIGDPRTRPVMVRYMAAFVERFESDPDLQQMYGDISLTGLEQDPHVRGMTPEALAKIAASLADAQKPSAT